MMFLKLSILSYLFFSLLNLNQTVLCKPSPESYENYLISVLHHIGSQPGWMSKMHLSLRIENDQDLNVDSFLFERTTRFNYMIKIQQLKKFINCRYSEILFTFNDLLENFLAHCLGFLLNNEVRELVYCASQLKNVCTRCADFFEQLKAAILFLDQLDLRIIDPEKDNIKTIVEEVNSYYRFFNWKKRSYINVDDNLLGTVVFDEFKNIRRFLENNAKPKAIALMNDAHNVCIINPHEDFVGMEEQLIVYESEHTISKMIVTYCHQIFFKEYVQMGFDQLINPDAKGYVMPLVSPWSTVNGIEFIKKLFGNPGWAKLSYIRVKKHKKCNEVINFTTPVDKNNYQFVQIYLSQLIKLRYAELVLYFHCIITLFISTCFKLNQFDVSFIECAIHVHGSMKLSTSMLTSMLIAIEKIKYSSKEPCERDIKWPLQNIIESIIDYVENFELNNYAPVDFTEIVAIEYLATLHELLTNVLYDKINILLKNTSRHCKSDYVISKEAYLNEILYPQLHTTPEQSISFKDLYQLTGKFCSEVQSEDFEQLGFSKTII